MTDNKNAQHMWEQLERQLTSDEKAQFAVFGAVIEKNKGNPEYALKERFLEFIADMVRAHPGIDNAPYFRKLLKDAEPTEMFKQGKASDSDVKSLVQMAIGFAKECNSEEQKAAATEQKTAKQGLDNLSAVVNSVKVTQISPVSYTIEVQTTHRIYSDRLDISKSATKEDIAYKLRTLLPETLPMDQQLTAMVAKKVYDKIQAGDFIREATQEKKKATVGGPQNP